MRHDDESLPFKLDRLFQASLVMRRSISADRLSNVSSSNVLRATALRAADRLPLLSVVLHRALGLLAQGDEVSIRDLGSVIEEDVVITGSLLAVANSVLYGRAGGVPSVRQAIARLGIRKTRNVLLGLTVSRCLKSVPFPEAWSSARFNAHSLAVAVLSDLIVQKASCADAEWAFMAGLLHDIGLPLIAVGLPEEFRAITAGGDSEQEIVGRQHELLGFTHFEIGAELLDRWNCPATVRQAVLLSECTEVLSEQPLSLGKVVRAASLLADANGASLFNPVSETEVTTQLLGALQIPEPIAFIATFRAEHNGILACAA